MQIEKLNEPLKSKSRKVLHSFIVGDLTDINLLEMLQRVNHRTLKSDDSFLSASKHNAIYILWHEIRNLYFAWQDVAH